MTQVKRRHTTMWMMYGKSNVSLRLLQVGNVCKWPRTTQWGEKKCPSFTFLWATSSPKTILTDDWCSDGKMRWRAPSAGERWDGDRPTARWEGIKTAHWCCVNPRPACSWHLYLLRSHTRGCRRPTLPSCCRTAARMKAFWWTSPGVWTESGENREGGGGRRVTAPLTRDETNKVFCYLLTLQSRHKSRGQPPRWLRWG